MPARDQTLSINGAAQVIVIVGGGITGLSAAYELSRQAVPFLLLEASPRLGGLIMTERIGGFTLDAGPDSILAQKPAAIQLCEELGLGPRLMKTTVPRTAFVLKRGRLHRLPSPSVLGIPTSVSAITRYDLLPLFARARIALEPAMPRGSATDESVASFFRRRFGAETVELIAEPLLGGIHAGDIEQLSMPSLFPRLIDAERSPGKVLRHLRNHPVRTAEGLFRSLRGGMHEIVTAIISRLPVDAVRTETPAVALRRSGASWQVADPLQTHDARAVIIAAPAHSAAALFASVDADAAGICTRVPYVSTASVALGYKRRDISHPLAGSGFVVARRHNALRITACTWVSSKWEDRAPEGHALIRAFVGGAHDPNAVEMTDDALIEVAIRDLSPILGFTGAPVLARVYRWKDAGAQHTVGHRARMNELTARLRALPGLFVAGSGFDSIGIPDCVAHGRAVAAAALNYATMRT